MNVFAQPIPKTAPPSNPLDFDLVITSPQWSHVVGDECGAR